MIVYYTMSWSIFSKQEYELKYVHSLDNRLYIFQIVFWHRRISIINLGAPNANHLTVLQIPEVIFLRETAESKILGGQYYGKWEKI